MEGAGLVGGLGAELQEVESRAEQFPLTRAALTLLDRMTECELPPGATFAPWLGWLQVVQLLGLITE